MVSAASLAIARRDTVAEALAFWQRKAVLSWETYRALEALAKQWAFSTQLDFTESLMLAVFDDIAASLAAGETVRGFRTRVEASLAEFGAATDPATILAIPPHRLNLLFRQNWINSLASGLYSDMFSPEGKSEAAWWRYNAIHDSRTDDPCLELDGSIFEKDDAAARCFLPPLHFNCRCYVTSIADAPEEIGKAADFRERGVAPDAGFDFDKASLASPSLVAA